MAARTDIASESEYILNGTDLQGIERQRHLDEKSMLETDFIRILTADAAEKIGRPMGRYMTFTLTDKSFEADSTLLCARAALIAKHIRSLMPSDMRGGALFAGLGNRRVTPDSVGPLCADRVIATRHLKRTPLKGIHLNDTAVISAGVMAQTGLESAELVRAAAELVKPAVIIVCDAFACSDISHLGTVISACDTGLRPGSGVNNSRAEISKHTMGVPCVAIGIPTVADAGAVTMSDSDDLRGLVVTPGGIDAVVSFGSSLIALAVNMALQPELTAEEILAINS